MARAVRVSIVDFMTTTDSAPEHSAPLSRSFHFFLWTRMLSTAANQILNVEHALVSSLSSSLILGPV